MHNKECNVKQNNSSKRATCDGGKLVDSGIHFTGKLCPQLEGGNILHSGHMYYASAIMNMWKLL